MIKSYLLAALLLTGLAVNGQEHRCATAKKLDELKAQDPGLEQRMMQQEHQMQALIANNAGSKQSAAVVRIPVVVHVVYRNSTQNISFAQVQSQITALNKDFRRTNSDTSSTPSGFKPLAGDAQIEFCLATRDPNGNYTTGVTYTSTTVNQIGNTNSYYNTAQGGHDAWDRDRYLNLWVCDIDGVWIILFSYYPFS